MSENIAQMIEAAIKGSHRVRVTLDPETRDIISQLLELEEGSIIQLSEADSKALNDIVTSSSGFDQKHPTIIITISDQFDADWFVEKISPAIESIEVA